MKIGLFDVDSHNFPNLPLMKISAWHKMQGDEVEFINFLDTYDKVYVSKVFGDEYSQMDMTAIQAKEIVFGGTGFAITVENGVEVYHKDRDPDLPYEIEHIYPDYSLYPKLTRDTAYGFLTRGCCNNCDYCIVSQKEGLCSKKVADLSEFWRGQKHIKLLDANLLACRDRIDLLQQLIDSKAKVDFTQGLDARFMTDEIAEMVSRINISMVHFAFDKMENEKAICKGLEAFNKVRRVSSRETVVYILTNKDTSFSQDVYRVKKVLSLGCNPDIRIYRKTTAPQFLRDLQRWANSKYLLHSTKFCDYAPRVDGKTMGEIYGKEVPEVFEI